MSSSEYSDNDSEEGFDDLKCDHDPDRFKNQIRMSEVWNTSVPSQVNKMVFNWKIENFDRVLNTFGGNGFESHEFKVGSHEGKILPLKLRLQKSPVEKLASLKVDGVLKNPVSNFSLISIEVVSNRDKVYLAGTLEFELEGSKVLGIFGNPDEEDFNLCSKWMFTNKTNSCWYSSSSTSGRTSTTSFCVDNSTQTLKIQVQLTSPGVVANTISFVPSEFTVKEIGASRLVADIKSLLIKADEYSDFHIVCDDQKFPCHEAILRTRSPVFDKMFQQKMIESTTRVLNILDVKKDSVEALLEYLYTGEITKNVGKESELIYIADKYEIAGLLELCFHKLPEVEEDMVVDILIMADRHNLKDFKKVAMQRILMNKSKFGSDEAFVDKMKRIPHLLVEFFQQFN